MSMKMSGSAAQPDADAAARDHGLLVADDGDKIGQVCILPVDLLCALIEARDLEHAGDELRHLVRLPVDDVERGLIVRRSCGRFCARPRRRRG